MIFNCRLWTESGWFKEMQIDADTENDLVRQAEQERRALMWLWNKEVFVTLEKIDEGEEEADNDWGKSTVGPDS